MDAVYQQVECPHCHARYRVDMRKAKVPVVQIRCPGCKEIFALRLSIPPSEAEVTAATAAVPDSATKIPDHRKALIVDDAKFFREVIVDLLKPLDLHCFTAENAEAAILILQQERPALMLLDLNLPGQSGFDFLRAVRADARYSGMKVLAMSGVFRDEADAAAALAAGADDFISKSFKPGLLQSRISALLAS